MRNLMLKAALAVLALSLAACQTHPRPPRQPDRPYHPAAAMLIPYAAPDGTLSRAQMETGLHRDFAKADANHDGCLDENEVRAVNAERWKEDASTASPLIDFKHNGCVDYDEFAALPRSIFDQLDASGKGVLTAQQLNAAAKPAQTAPTQPTDSSTGHHHRGQPPQQPPSNQN